MYPRLIPIIFCLFGLTTPGSAMARCQGAVMLGALHDAYLAAVTEDGQTRLRAAQTLLVILGNSDPGALARQVAQAGIEVELQRLSEAVEDAATLAMQIASTPTQVTPSFDHGLNIDWMGNLYASTRCSNSASTASLTPVRDTSDGRNASGAPPADETRSNNILWWAIALLLVTSIVVYAAPKFKMPLAIRKRQVERMPRYPVTMTVDVIFTDQDGEIQEDKEDVIDISRGGLKLNWASAPTIGTTVTIPILSEQHVCRVAWSNSHYAGLVLETPLTQQQLSQLQDQ